VLPRPHNDLDRDKMIEMPRVARGGVTPFDSAIAAASIPFPNQLFMFDLPPLG
jgi:hypothetical protein